MKNKILFVSLLSGLSAVMLCNTVNAQRKAATSSPEHLHLAAITKGYGDSVVIRWAPADPVAWLMGNKSGYRITRIDLSDAGHPVITDLSPQGIFPTPDAQLKLADTTAFNAGYLMVAERMLYGGAYSVSRSPARSFTGQIKNEHSALALRYMLALMAADYYAPAASALALRYADHQVKNGGKYIYVIKCPSADKKYIVDSVAVLAKNIRSAADPVPRGFEAKSLDHKAELYWDRRQAGNFSGYFMERSDDGGKTFRALTKGPYRSTYIPPTGDSKRDSLLKRQNSLLRDHQVYTDSLPENYKTYTYRLKAINGFGEISGYTSTISVQGKDLTPPAAAIIDSVKNTADRSMTIWWRQLKKESDLAGYYINRGTSAKGPFHLISPKMLDKNTSTFIDTAALPHQPNFYVVIAVDTSKNSTVSAPGLAYLKDTLPPDAPVGVNGTIDSSGIVRLHWKANHEKDLKGYQVFSSYNSHNRFSQISTAIISDTSFTDSVATASLDRRVYYKIVALDGNFNHSRMSALATLTKIIVVPPSAPVAGEITENKNGVRMEWRQSQSEGVKGYQLYRKESGKDWQPLATLPPDQNQGSIYFIDTTRRPNTDYYYAAETLDSVAGVHSTRSFPIHVRWHATATLATPDELTATFNPKLHQIKLSWTYNQTGDYFFVLYRSLGNEPLTPWHSYEKTQQSAVDEVKEKNLYQYALKIVARDKSAASSTSKTISVQTIQ
jgi:hypothetical protein